MKLVHTADLHLGSKFSGLGREKGNKRRKDLRKTLKKIVEVSEKEEADLLLIVGDLFDQERPLPSDLDYVKRVLGEADLQVIIVPGNHDPHTENGLWTEVGFPDHVMVIEDSNFQRIELPEVVIYSASYDPSKGSKRILKNTEIGGEEKPVIVAVHGSYTYGIDWEDEPEGKEHYPIEPKNRNSLQGVDYLALGHYHSFKTIKSGVYTCYPGCPEGLRFSDEGNKYVAIIEMGPPVKVERVPINTRTYEKHQIDCTDFESTDEIRSQIERLKDKNKLLRIRLKGAPSPELIADPKELEDLFSDDFFHIEIKEEFLPSEIPDLSEKTVMGVFVKNIRSKIEEADKDEKKALNLAMRYGLAALDDRL